jgi:LmbE family N-acetylglucosaminyl deacetylase
MKSILLVLAHPDDESLFVGGTVAKYVHAGWRVDLLCATRGEAGQYGPYDDAPDLGALREQELKEAAKELGITSVTYLGYGDGKLSMAPTGELEDTLHRHFLDRHPDIVITFETGGISNHPDHMKTSFAATFAFHKYATNIFGQKPLGSRDPKRYLLRQEEEEEKSIEPKLYYACMPDSTAEYLKKKHVVSEVSFGKPWKGVPDKTVTTVIAFPKFQTKKKNALRKHITQTADVERFLSIPNQPLMQKEYFILRYIGKQEVFMSNTDRISDRL